MTSSHCPICCNTLHKHSLFKDIRSAQQIKTLTVKCSYLDTGCEWVGELCALEKHLQRCDYALLPCPNECKSTCQIIEVLRRDMHDHLDKCPRRQYECPHCKETGEYQERTTTHLETCLQVEVPCSYAQCQVIIPRCEVSTHQSTTCDYEPVLCKYADVGCEERPLRKDLKEHEENECPRRQYECPHCEETGEYQEMTTTHLDTCPQVKVPCPNAVLCHVIIPCCEVSTHRSQCEYEPVPCKYTEIGCEEIPLRKDLKKHEENDRLHLRITTEKVLELTQEVANLQSRLSHQEMLTKMNKEALIKDMANGHVLLKKKKDSQMRAQLEEIRKKRNRLMFEIQVHKKENSAFISPPLYSTDNKYEVCIIVHANGIDSAEGTHVSVDIEMRRQPRKDAWAQGTVIIELLNQLSDQDHHKKTVTFSTNHFDDDGNATLRLLHFIPHSELDCKGFLHYHEYRSKDKLTFRVSVHQGSVYKPWLDCDNY